MDKLANTYYSRAHPKVLREDGQRVAQQIISCFRFSSPKLPLKGCLVLDLGTSNGSIAYHIAPFVKQITGIDLDKTAIADGKQKYHRKNFQLKLFDGEKIPYPKNSFDLVIFRRSYGSISDPQSMSDEIYRVLKPEGLCYFEGHNKLFSIEGDHWIPFLTRSKKYYYIERYKTYWGVRQLFSRFAIYMLTPLIVKNPGKFQFSRLYTLNKLTRFIPLFILQLLEPTFPDFIWILKKLSHQKTASNEAVSNGLTRFANNKELTLRTNNSIANHKTNVKFQTEKGVDPRGIEPP